MTGCMVVLPPVSQLCLDAPLAITPMSPSSSTVACCVPPPHLLLHDTCLNPTRYCLLLSPLLQLHQLLHGMHLTLTTSYCPTRTAPPPATARYRLNLTTCYCLTRAAPPPATAQPDLLLPYTRRTPPATASTSPPATARYTSTSPPATALHVPHPRLLLPLLRLGRRRQLGRAGGGRQGPGRGWGRAGPPATRRGGQRRPHHPQGARVQQFVRIRIRRGDWVRGPKPHGGVRPGAGQEANAVQVVPGRLVVLPGCPVGRAASHVLAARLPVRHTGRRLIDRHTGRGAYLDGWMTASWLLFIFVAAFANWIDE